MGSELPVMQEPGNDPRFDRFQRMIQAHADALMRPVMDDKGVVLQPGISDRRKALAQSIKNTNGYIASLQGQGPQFAKPLQDYLNGASDNLPADYLPSTDPVPSKATMERLSRVEAVRQQSIANRQDSAPWYAKAGQAAIDDFAMPVSGFLASKAQIPVDLVTGGLNLVGASIPHIDVRAAAFSLTALGVNDNIFDAYAETAAKLNAVKEGMSGIGKVANTAAEFGGMARGFGIKKVSQALAPGAKAAAKLAEKLTARLESEGAKKFIDAMARGAGMFAEYDFLTARGENGEALSGLGSSLERAKAAAHGLIAGAAIGGFSSLAGRYMRFVLEKPASKLLAEDKASLEAVKQWGVKNGIKPLNNVPPESYLKELTQRWAEAGAPGMKASVRTMAAAVGGAGIEGAGFSMLDDQFRTDLYEIGSKVANGQVPTNEEIDRILTTYGASALGMLAAKMPLGQIPALQRRVTARGERATAPAGEQAVEARQPEPTKTPEQIAEEGKARARESAQKSLFRKSLGDRNVRLAKEGDGAAVDQSKPTDTQMAAVESLGAKSVRERQHARNMESISMAERDGENVGGRRDQREEIADQMWDLLFGAQERAKAAEADAEAARAEAKATRTRESAQQALEDVVAGWENNNLERLGWRRRNTGPGSDTHELDGTDMAFEVVDGRVARPNKALREALDLPSEVDVEDLGMIVERAGLMSALNGKSRLPGTEIWANGVIAEVGDGLRPPVMRAVRNGTIYESPLQPVPAWTKAGEVQARGKDVLLPEQRQAVTDLRTILDHRMDIDRGDRALFDAAIDVLDSVSAEKNRSVAEALHFLPNYLEEIAAGDPMTAGRRIKTLAETLTIKAPETVVSTEAAQLNRFDREEAKRAAYAKDVSERIVPEGSTSKATMRPDAARFLSEFVPSDTELGKQLEALGAGTDRGEVTVTPSEFKALTAAMEKFLPRIQQRLQGKELKQFRSRAAAAEAKVEEFGRGFGIEPPRYDAYTGTYVPSSAKAGEGGFLDVGAMAEGVRRAWDKVTGLFKDDPMVGVVRAIGSTVANPVADLALKGIAQNAIHALREGGQREMADRIDNALVNARKIQKETSADLEAVADAARTRNPELEKLIVGETSDTGSKAAYETGLVFSESKLMQRHGITEAILTSDKAKDAVRTSRSLTKKLRSIASRLGMQIRNAEGELVHVREATNYHVLTRMPTKHLTDAIMAGRGELYEDIVSAWAKENNKTEVQIEKMFADQRATWQDVKGIEKIDPIEVMRQLDFMSDHIITRRGKTVRLLESNLGRHATRMVESAARRFGFVQEFGQNLKAEGEPSTYSKIISEIKGPDGKPDHRMQKVAATAFRSAMGMSIHEPRLANVPGFEAGSALHTTLDVAGALMDVAAAAKMTMSPVHNVVEPLGTATALMGADRYAKAEAYYTDALFDGRLSDVLKERVEIGGFHLSHPEFLWGGEHSNVENIKAVARSVANTLLKPFEVSQLMRADVVVHHMVESLVNDMRAGEGRASDVMMLRIVHGFTDAEARAMIEGRGTDAHYDRVLYNSLARITKRGEMPVEKSSFGQNKAAQGWVRFTGYFQLQMMKMRQHAILMKEAKTPEQATEAAVGMAKLLGFNMAAFAVSQSVLALLRGGEKDLMSVWADMVDNPGSAVAGALIGSFLGAPGSAIAGAVMAGLTGDKEDKDKAFDSLVSMALPVSETIHMWQFTHAMLQRASGNAVTEGPYIGKTPLQQLGYFAGLEVPALRTALGGLAGIAPNYMGTDPNLESAMKVAYRWDDRNGYKGGFSTDDSEEHAKFLDVMRGIANRIKAGDDPATVEDMIRQGMPDTPDKSIIASLMARRMLSGARWTKLSDEDKVRKLKHLGPERIETLRGWDLALEAIADRFRPMYRR